MLTPISWLAEKSSHHLRFNLNATSSTEAVAMCASAKSCLHEPLKFITLCLRPFTGCREIHSVYMSDSTEVFGNWHPWAEPSNNDAHELENKYFIFLPPQVEWHWDVFFTIFLRPQWDWVQLPITGIYLVPWLASSDPLPNKSCPQILLSTSREMKPKIYWKYFFSDPHRK